jgi:hypothetical protein
MRVVLPQAASKERNGIERAKKKIRVNIPRDELASPEGLDLIRPGGFQNTLRHACTSGKQGGPFNLATSAAAQQLLFDSQASPTGLQVGGYGGRRYSMTGTTMHVVVNNDAGANSFFYHLAPNSPLSSGPFRTIHQQFDLTIPHACR